MSQPSLRSVTSLFLKIGNLTFGGGDPTMAALQSEFVKREWMTSERYGLIYSLARITPGTNVLALCAGSGWDLAKWPGALLAVLAVSVPTSILVALLSAGYDSWISHRLAIAAISGVIAGAIGIMAAGAYILLKPHLRARTIKTATIACLAFLLAARLKMTPIQILALAAAAGAVWHA